MSTTDWTSAGLGDVAQRAFDLEALRAHLGDGRRQPLLAPRAQHERGAGFGEAFGHLLSEAARPAGDDRDAAVQSEQFVDGWHVVRLILPTRYDVVNCIRRPRDGDSVRTSDRHGTDTLQRPQRRTVSHLHGGAGEVFIREDLTDEQRLFGQTAAEFMHKEVLPVVEQLYTTTGR